MQPTSVAEATKYIADAIALAFDRSVDLHWLRVERSASDRYREERECWHEFIDIGGEG